jgi:ketosteroid isomerase-like protein
MTRQSEHIAAIQQLADDWRADSNAGDAGALVDLDSNDPVVIPQSQPRKRSPGRSRRKSSSRAKTTPNTSWARSEASLCSPACRPQR